MIFVLRQIRGIPAASRKLMPSDVALCALVTVRKWCKFALDYIILMKKRRFFIEFTCFGANMVVYYWHMGSKEIEHAHTSQEDLSVLFILALLLNGVLDIAAPSALGGSNVIDGGVVRGD
jgi:hypothetical protein